MENPSVIAFVSLYTTEFILERNPMNAITVLNSFTTNIYLYGTHKRWI